MFQKIREECGVFGIFDATETLPCAKLTYYALYALQHRGQESCGIAVNTDGSVYQHKNLGLVRDVFHSDATLIEGHSAIGHVRFSRTLARTREDAQPIVSKYTNGFLAVANNGAVWNRAALAKELEEDGAIFQTDTIAELITHLLSKEWVRSGNIEKALSDLMERLQGGYALVIMSPSKLVGARDPFGIRPLCLGRVGGAYMLASESAAFDAVGGEFIRDIEPGEVIKINRHGITSYKENCGKKSHLCAFEYIYFARPDSVVDSVSIYELRKKIGALLAARHPANADMVIGVPFSGLCAAIGYSHASGIPFEYALMKNSYIGRDISPDQSLKVNAIQSCVQGKRVVLVDDSIVSGNTCAKLVSLLRSAGAKEVHVRISSPPFIGPCYYGSYIPDKEHLATCRYSMEELREKLGADSLGFSDTEDLSLMGPDQTMRFCDACYTGHYIAGPCSETEEKGTM